MAHELLSCDCRMQDAWWPRLSTPASPHLAMPSGGADSDSGWRRVPVAWCVGQPGVQWQRGHLAAYPATDAHARGCAGAACVQQRAAALPCHVRKAAGVGEAAAGQAGARAQSTGSRGIVGSGGGDVSSAPVAGSSDASTWAVTRGPCPCRRCCRRRVGGIVPQRWLRGRPVRRVAQVGAQLCGGAATRSRILIATDPAAAAIAADITASRAQRLWSKRH
eukprot:354113-Chlamydomonas_euryale.AAC.4